MTPLTDATFYNAISSCLRRNDKIGACSQAEYGEIPYWDVSRVTNMRGAFSNYEQFNADISNWDVSSVTADTGYMFYNLQTQSKHWDVGHFKRPEHGKHVFIHEKL